jgi:hypothetical protein
MKRAILTILVLFCMISLVSSCNKTSNDNTILEFSFDKNGNYSGFSNLPTNYNIKEAKNGQYFVKQGIEVIANENVLKNFIETSSRKENIGVRIVSFSKDSVDSPFFLDLFYNNGYYYLFDSSSKENEKQPYSYLRSLEGKFGNPLKDSGVVVLTNDNKLTFDMVMKSLTSSNTEDIKSIPLFKIVLFK